MKFAAWLPSLQFSACYNPVAQTRVKSAAKAGRRGLLTTAKLLMEDKVFSPSAKVAARGGDDLGEKRKVIVDGNEFEVDIENDGNTYTATVDGREFKIEVPHAPQAQPKRAARSSKKKSGKISANIPGTIVTLEVALGDPVSEGQVVLILEAMKMQNEITAPIAGTVVEIHCEEGQSIEANVPLVLIEPKQTGEDEKSE